MSRVMTSLLARLAEVAVDRGDGTYADFSRVCCVVAPSLLGAVIPSVSSMDLPGAALTEEDAEVPNAPLIETLSPDLFA